MLVVNRYTVAESDAEEFLALAGPVLEALAARPGYLGGQVGRSTDEVDRWVVVTRWEGVGAYRRALGSYEVKVRTAPLMHRAVDEPGAYEVLVDQPVGAAASTAASDRAPADAGRPGPGR
ncbi:antibiotic biosynthesis monooxygenase family protein [Thalassiella azotivora]